ncbi:MAG: 30S ribosomal protein S12 methylthiotransferase RimO [Ignavibacteria bacterium]|nr:30S ribosomal protein S12 methylthiotransferase RimO [Ignavibacteria bacterium]
MKVKKDKVQIITLGCSKNLVDSEHLMAHMKAGDIEIVEEGKKADVVIINTCGFIQSAKEESINTILAAVENKKRGKIDSVFVAGCLSERYMDDLRKEIPEVDEYFGNTYEKKTVFGILNSLGIDYRKNLIGERLVTTPKHYAYLKISEGCDNPCSFCAIPIMRGGHVSTPLKEIINEAEKLSDKGVKELIIIGQDTTYWGKDINGNREISKVLNGISNVAGIEWIRLMYAYPSGFPDDLIQTIVDNPKICNYIDIPIQHVSDNVLKVMRRGTTKSRQIKLLEKIRKEIPGVAIRTTVLTGHPGETEKDFEELLDFIKEFRFDRLGVFTYSEEEGTHAADLKDSITQKEKNLRQKKILDAQKIISLENNSAMVNSSIEVLIERKENDYYIGRTYKDAPEIDQEVYIESGKKLKAGNFYNVRVTDFEDFDLFGVLNK